MVGDLRFQVSINSFKLDRLFGLGCDFESLQGHFCLVLSVRESDIYRVLSFRYSGWVSSILFRQQ